MFLCWIHLNRHGRNRTCAHAVLETGRLPIILHAYDSGIPWEQVMTLLYSAI